MTSAPSDSKVVLITGGARRIGAAIARGLHQSGYRLALHYHRSQDPVRALAEELEAMRPRSVTLFKQDLSAPEAAEELADAVLERLQRLDALVNNASSFYPTPLGAISAAQWEELFATNARAPLFLTQAFAPALRAARGAVVNLIDIHAERPLKNHTVYCMAKAALQAMTLSLALEMSPEVRVNGVSPGAILWPDAPMSQDERERLLARVALKRKGEPEDIAAAVNYLLNAPYVTGQILAVDGGRSLSM